MVCHFWNDSWSVLCIFQYWEQGAEWSGIFETIVDLYFVFFSIGSSKVWYLWDNSWSVLCIFQYWEQGAEWSDIFETIVDLYFVFFSIGSSKVWYLWDNSWSVLCIFQHWEQLMEQLNLVLVLLLCLWWDQSWLWNLSFQLSWLVSLLFMGWS